jgi:hypothetical protein
LKNKVGVLPEEYHQMMYFVANQATTLSPFFVKVKDRVNHFNEWLLNLE